VKTAKEMLEPTPTHEDWIPLLEVAAREVFELMLGCKLTACDLATDDELDVTSMVGLAGQLCGVLSVRCSIQAATIVASKMLGMEPESVGEELADALGEVGNMVAGNFKNKITGLGDGCMLSVPTVIIGNDYNVHPLNDSYVLELRLLFESHPLVISLSVHN
jgi:chemotaxis protein CheX